MPIEWRSQWDDVSAEDMSAYTTIDFDGYPSMTLQEPTDDQDINVLMKRFGVKDGSALPYWSNAHGLYGDFSSFSDDPTENANIIREGQVQFALLPAAVRQKFHSPEELFAFLDNDANLAEARQLGLLKPEEPTPAPPTPPTS